METQELKYPIGVQSFQEIRKGYVYVDKTPLVWRLTTRGKYYFLSRPRRFGKSLLLSTIEAYFMGRKELFEGLYISTVEKEWAEYPVLHLDLNTGVFNSKKELRKVLGAFLKDSAKKYGVSDNPRSTPPLRFKHLLEELSQKCGRNAVILVDEYDKPLMNNIDDSEKHEEIQKELKAFYGVMKTCDQFIRFGMITGVGRFSKVSIFSDLNNLNDISLDDAYNAICGISESELNEYFSESIATLAKRYKTTPGEMHAAIQRKYDGYRFGEPELTERIYNPFSLVNCFEERSLRDYWFDTGTPSFLIKTLMKVGFNFSKDEIDVMENVLKGVNVAASSPYSLLYQTGYFTIKDYDPRFQKYTLGIPNEEVRSGFSNLAFIAYGGKKANEFSIPEFLSDLETGNVDGFMQRLQSMIAHIPYEQAVQSEAVYHNVLYLLFTMLGYQTESECHMNNGRTDMVVKTRQYIYIFEFKFNENVAKAMCQINRRQYDKPYQADGRQIVKVAVNFASDQRNIADWIVEKG